MIKKHPALIAFIVLLIASLACGQPNTPPTPDQNALDTSVAQTVAVRQTQAILNAPATATLTPTPTFTRTVTVTPVFTATLGIPSISVSRDTNCRVGPGEIYERVGYLLVGEVTEVFGRDPQAKYWYVRNLDAGAEYCWVWGEYATVSGNVFAVPAYTPLPIPVTAFTASFAGVKSCSTAWWFDFKLTNGSGAPYRSISIIVRDTDKGTESSVDTNDFTLNDGCNPAIQNDTLPVDETISVSSPSLAYNPSGHNFNAKIKVCTEINQGGTCLTQELNFKPQ
jgi:hypothetical protein